MSMSDCIKCWETPCACGHDYLDWPQKKLEDVYKVIRLEMIRRKSKVIEEEATNAH